MTRRHVQINGRTKQLSDAAVRCRTLGHAREVLPQGSARRLELAQRGQREQVLYCTRCTWTQRYLIDVENGDVVGRSSGKYPDGYLLNDKGGRLSRSEARQALYARERI
jgi:hypothetical protein